MSRSDPNFSFRTVGKQGKLPAEDNRRHAIYQDPSHVHGWLLQSAQSSGSQITSQSSHKDNGLGHQTRLHQTYSGHHEKRQNQADTFVRGFPVPEVSDSNVDGTLREESPVLPTISYAGSDISNESQATVTRRRRYSDTASHKARSLSRGGPESDAASHRAQSLSRGGPGSDAASRRAWSQSHPASIAFFRQVHHLPDIAEPGSRRAA